MEFLLVFDWASWMMLGYILNFFAIFATLFLTMYMVLNISHVNRLKIFKYSHEQIHSRKFTFFYIVNYLIPYYEVFVFFMLLINTIKYYNKTPDSVIKIIDNISKLDIGAKKDI